MAIISIRPDYDAPPDTEIFEYEVDVSGVRDRVGPVVAFIRGKKHRIEWEREPQNPHDQNAIKIIGVTKSLFGSKRRHVGYVPAEIAAKIAAGRWLGELTPRLRYMQISEGGYGRITFDIVGPSGRKKEYSVGTERFM